MPWPSKGRYDKTRTSVGYTPAQARRILRKYPTCFLAYADICTIVSTQVHHVVEWGEGGSDDDENLRGVCKPCHDRHSALYSVAKRDEWKRRPEKHPGILD